MSVLSQRYCVILILSTIKVTSENLVKVSDSDYDVKKLANESPVYNVID